jgi:transposase
MPQRQLPLFPDGVTQISGLLAFCVTDDRVTYLNGNMPVFFHEKDDIATFRMITAQFCINGNARQAEIAKVFGIPKVTVKRAVKRYREEGPKGFYAQRKTRGAAVLTAEVVAGAQSLLDDGLETAEVARRLELKPDTLSKAVRAGRLHKPSKKKT